MEGSPSEHRGRMFVRSPRPRAGSRLLLHALPVVKVGGHTELIPLAYELALLSEARDANLIEQRAICQFRN